MAIEPALALQQLPDGVYLHLPEEVYFAQDRLGSSDLIKLHKHKEGWWWQSRWNPDRNDGQTTAQTYGSALHAIMLEGLGAYETRFAVAPDKRDYDGLLFTIPQIKAALIEEGFDLKGSSGYKLPDWLDVAAINIPHRPCWDAIERDFERSITAEDGTRRSSVTAVEDRMLRVMWDQAMEDADVRGLLGAGQDVPALAEVSVFWTDDRNVARRARFDKPVPRFTLDLKSLGNWEGRELAFAVGDRILREGYDIQVGDQHVARRYMNQMVVGSDGKMLHGGTEEERAWITAIAIKAKRWDWAWLFYQKPEPSGRAPIIFPVYEKWRGRYHVSGHRKAVRAIDTYLSGVERFGLGDRPSLEGRIARPWGRVEPMHYTDEKLANDEALPGMEAKYLTPPHFGWDEVPVPGEEEALA